MFSKYDVYTTVQSMYCYPDTDILINKLDIRDKAELKRAEEEFTAVKQMALLQEPIKGRFTKTPRSCLPNKMKKSRFRICRRRWQS